MISPRLSNLGLPCAQRATSRVGQSAPFRFLGVGQPWRGNNGHAGAHQGLALLGHAHAVVVGLQEAVAPELQRVAHVHSDAARLGWAVRPVLHLQSGSTVGDVLEALWLNKLERTAPEQLCTIWLA